MSDFIEKIAKYVKAYAPKYGIDVYSPIIAQAVLESAMGTSELAVNANNYFGLKYKSNVAEKSYVKEGSEQNQDGTYYSGVMMWCKFENIAQCVNGYFEFISAKRYANLKGVKNPIEYLEKIKEDGYATSLKYVDNLLDVIEKYNLTKYDPYCCLRINVHAGHNPDGKNACGAIGLIKESTEARKVKDLVISGLRQLGHEVYDCTVEDGISQSDVLQKIVNKCNAHRVNLDISIHFNSGSGDISGNGATSGVEVYTYSTSSKAVPYAKSVCEHIKELGYRNRGVKYSTNLYVLNHTKAPAMLIECCFVDDKDDVKRYDPELMAGAIIKGITGQEVQKVEGVKEESGKLYRVQCGAYRKKENAEEQVMRLKAAGFNAIVVE